MSKYKVTMLEQETIILWNREETQANVYTFEPSLKKKLENLSKTHPDIFVKTEDNGIGGITYCLPKELITIRNPRAKRELSEDQRERLRMQLKENLIK